MCRVCYIRNTCGCGDFSHRRHPATAATHRVRVCSRAGLVRASIIIVSGFLRPARILDWSGRSSSTGDFVRGFFSRSLFSFPGRVRPGSSAARPALEPAQALPRPVVSLIVASNSIILRLIADRRRRGRRRTATHRSCRDVSAPPDKHLESPSSRRRTPSRRVRPAYRRLRTDVRLVRMASDETFQRFALIQRVGGGEFSTDVIQQIIWALAIALFLFMYLSLISP